MLREEQIDLRRQRARAARFTIDNVGKNRVFSEYRVANPETQGQYTVGIRGFDTGDNTCTCPDFKANTLGTCKHIEAVLEELREELPRHTQKKKAVVTQPEIYLHYGDQLRLGIHLPPRHSDKLARLAQKYFDGQGLWHGRYSYGSLVADAKAAAEEVTFLDGVFDFIEREVERVEMREKERGWVQQLEAGTLDLHLLDVPLYDYQVRGALFLACRGRSILGDDMGLGKTVQTLAAVELLARERGIERVLVVAPASVKYQWEGEIRKFTARSVQVIDGSPEARQDQYLRPAFYRLVNYEQVVRDREAINAWKPDVVVLDEAQRIKNWESKTSREVKKLHSRYAMVLTGTPLENKLEELYSIVQFVDERRFGPAFQFLFDHRVLDDAGNLVGYRNLDSIRDKLAPIFLRRTRGEVLTQLPERTDSTRFVELAEEQRGPYEEQRTVLARLLGKPVLSELDRTRILACLVNLRTICDSTVFADPESHVSPKLDEFAELLPELLGSVESPHKLVVFSQWETMMRETARVLTDLGIGHVVLHGSLSGTERKGVLDTFRTDPTCRVFLSTDAGGTGLNLQMADTVVNLELPWNPAVLEQRIARVHRMGQERSVRVIHFVTRGTIEERVLRTLGAKKSLFAGLFEGDEDEVPFAALGVSGVRDAMRGLIGDSEELPPVEEPAPIATVAPPVVPVSPRASIPPAPSVWLAAEQLLDGIATLLAAGGPVPDDVRDRLRRAVRTIATQLHLNEEK